jgi:PTS system mannitol-specific IIC component
VLSNPATIVAMWAGGLTADTIWVLTGAGLVATPSPGSIFAYLAVTPPGQHLFVFTGVFAAAVVSFLVGTAILRLFPVKQEEAEKEEKVKTALPGSAPARA